MSSESLSEEAYLQQAKFIWKNYVPSNGAASTKIGELLRYNEKLRDEAQRNGNKNWREEHTEMAVFVRNELLASGLFSGAQASQIKSYIQRILNFEFPETEEEVYDFLMSRIVDWHIANPTPVPESPQANSPVAEAPKAPNPTAQTALTEALNQKSTEAALKAIAEGALLDFVDQENYGRTPLFSMAVRGHIDMIAFLLDQGAEINRVDNMGYSPWDFAMHKKEAQKYLKSRGALSAKKGEIPGKG